MVLNSAHFSVVTSSDPCVYANAAGQLETHPAGYLILRFKPSPWNVEALSELLIEAGALLLRHNWTRMLADIRQLRGFSQESLDWLQRDWFTREVPQPPRIYRALLLPAGDTTRSAVAQLRNLAPAFTQYVYFVDEQAAHNYLLALGS